MRTALRVGVCLLKKSRPLSGVVLPMEKHLVFDELTAVGARQLSSEVFVLQELKEMETHWVSKEYN